MNRKEGGLFENENKGGNRQKELMTHSLTPRFKTCEPYTANRQTSLVNSLSI